MNRKRAVGSDKVAPGHIIVFSGCHGVGRFRVDSYAVFLFGDLEFLCTRHGGSEVMAVLSVSFGECGHLALVERPPDNGGESCGKRFPVPGNAVQLSGAAVETVFVPAGADCDHSPGFPDFEREGSHPGGGRGHCGNQFYGAPVYFVAVGIDEADVRVIAPSRLKLRACRGYGHTEYVRTVGRSGDAGVAAVEHPSLLEELPVNACFRQIGEIVVILYRNHYFGISGREHSLFHERVYWCIDRLRLPVVSGGIAP